ncbi:MAG: DUF4114 domain-containing protein [Cyanobacteriota bacterium]
MKAKASTLGLPPVMGLVDGERDVFLFDSSNPSPDGELLLLDVEQGLDELLLDGVAPTGTWAEIRQQLHSLGITINAAPRIVNQVDTELTLLPGVEVRRDLAALGTDPDGDPLQLVKLEGPAWVETSGTTLRVTAPIGLSKEQLASMTLRLAFSDGQALVPFTLSPRLNTPPTDLVLTNTTTFLSENTSTASRIKLADLIISDDNLGSISLSLSGPDVASFEVAENSLFLKAGAALDFESKNVYTFDVIARDLAILESTPASARYSLAIGDVLETSTIPSFTTVVFVPQSNGADIPITVSLSNADLSPGSSLALISDLGINQAGLANLAELGITSNGTGLDFQLTLEPGASASLNALLDLVAADIDAQLSDIGGNRRADRKLLFYAVDTPSGAISPLTYDPITGAGARFFDLNNDGTPDFFSLSLIDGGYGDKDGLRNGVILDPSVAGFVDLPNLKLSMSTTGTVTVSDASNSAPAAVSVQATLNRLSSTANQIGFVVLNASEVSRADSLLSDLNWLRGRAQTLFSTLESQDVILPADVSFTRDFSLINGQSIRFFEVEDATLADLSSIFDRRFRLLNPEVVSSDPGKMAFSSLSGVSFSLSLLPRDPGLNSMIGAAQSSAPVLDLSAFTALQSLRGSVVLGREADLNSRAGFYRTLDPNGTVIAADGITRLLPGDSTYAAEALRTANVVPEFHGLSVADDQTSSRSFSGVVGGSFLAPFAQVNGNTFFAYAAANIDGISHFRSLGTNLFGLEDLVGGGDRDFDDLVIGFNFTAVT